LFAIDTNWIDAQCGKYAPYIFLANYNLKKKNPFMAFALVFLQDWNSFWKYDIQNL
jgi:hypothetical protein